MATLEISLKLTLNDGSVHQINSSNDFGDDDLADDDATEQYWAMLKGAALASEDDERTGRDKRKAARAKKPKK